MFDLTELTQAELIKGYHARDGVLLCNYCQMVVGGSQEPVMEAHLTARHGGASQALLTVASKYNALTPTQMETLSAFSDADKDQQAADALGVSASTVRHQKFTFREKAKSAKLYLAQYQAIFGETPVKATQYLPVSPDITRPDDRFKMTEAEYIGLVTKYFAPNLERLTLKAWPKGEKKLFGLMTRINAEFELDRKYPLTEVDGILKGIYEDYTLLKRYLVDDGFLDRTADGRTYWRVF